MYYGELAKTLSHINKIYSSLKTFAIIAINLQKILCMIFRVVLVFHQSRIQTQCGIFEVQHLSLGLGT